MWNCDERDWHTYIVLFLGTSLYYSQFPYSRQSLLYYPTLAWVRISSRYLILKFAFPHTRPSPIKFCFSAIIDIYQTLGLTLFYQDLVVQYFWFIIFTTGSSLRAAGRGGGIATIYGGIVDGKCMLSLVFLRETPGAYFPTSSSCHFKCYLPFSGIHGFIWRGIWKVGAAFLQLAVISTQHWFSFFPPCTVGGLKFILISHLFRLICQDILVL